MPLQGLSLATNQCVGDNTNTGKNLVGFENLRGLMAVYSDGRKSLQHKAAWRGGLAQKGHQ